MKSLIDSLHLKQKVPRKYFSKSWDALQWPKRSWKVEKVTKWAWFLEEDSPVAAV